MGDKEKKRIKQMLWYNIVPALLLTTTLLYKLVPPNNVDVKTYRLTVIGFGILGSYIGILGIPFVIALVLGGLMYLVKKNGFWEIIVKTWFVLWVIFTLTIVVGSFPQLMKH